MPLPLWVPLAELGVAAFALAVAVFLLRVGRRRAVNRNLALVLALEAVAAVGIAGAWLAGGEEGDFIGPFLGVLLIGYGALPWLYLRFLSVLDTPLAAWLRRRRVRSLLVVAASVNATVWAGWLVWSAFLASKIDPLFTMPWWPLLLYFSALTLSILAVAAFSLVASISAWRRTAPGTLERDRARAFTTAFGVRDLLYVVMAVLGLLTLYGDLSQEWSRNLLPLTTLLYVPVLAYGVLKTQLFNIELHLRRGVRATFMGAVFIVVLVTMLEILEKVVAWQLGWAAGFASAVVLTFGVKPVERVATRLAHRLIAPAEPATIEERKRGVYRVAFREVWQDGQIEPHERHRLTTLGAELGLAPREMAAIEDAVAAEQPPARPPRPEDAGRRELSNAIR